MGEPFSYAIAPRFQTLMQPAYVRHLTTAFHVVQDREPLSEKSLLAVKSDFRFACSWVQQFGILMRRAWLQTSRDKLPLIVTGIQVGQHYHALVQRITGFTC